MKRFVTLVLAFLMVIGMTGVSTASAGEALELYEITVYIENGDEAYTADTAVGKVILDEFGINIHYIPFTGDWNEKCALWLAGGDYPEVMRINSTDLMQSYISAGALLSWDEQLDNMPNYVSYAKEETLDVYRSISTDGKLYFTNLGVRASDPNGYPGIMVRSDLLEEQGWPNLLYASEWIEFFRVAKENNPSTYEDLDTVGMCFPLGESWAPNAMGLRGEKDLLGNQLLGYHTFDYTVCDLYADGAYQREVLEFFNIMYREGLMDKESFTDKVAQVSAKCNTTQAMGVFYATWAPANANTLFAEDEALSKYEYVQLPFAVDSM